MVMNGSTANRSPSDTTHRQTTWSCVGPGPHWLVAALLVALGYGTVGCGNNQNTVAPTPAPRSSPVTETFQGTLPLQGSVWRLVTAIQAGSLTAVLSGSDQPATEVGLALGLRNGNTCLVTRDVIAPAGASPRLSLAVDEGDYCVKVWDPGRLQSQLAFTVTVTYP